MKIYMLDYGEAFREQREERGISQGELARQIGTSRQNVSRWESNQVQPSIDFCVQLADFYGISLDELVGRDYNATSKMKSK